MPSELPGLLVVLSGPAGVGKSTVGERLLARDPVYVRMITATTRAPRGTERDGVDYHFQSREDFEEGTRRGAFLEYAEVHGQWYGTPLKPCLDALKAGKIVLLIIDVDGGKQVRGLDLDALLVFLAPPDRNRLIERLRGRRTEDEAAIARRLERVRRELGEAAAYDVVIVNDDLDACVESTARAVEEAREKLARRRAAGERIYPGLEKLEA